MLHNSAMQRSDWTSSPGSTILDILDARELSVEKFAASLGFTVSRAQSLIEGHMAINRSVACKLSRSLGSSVEFWLAREYDYRGCIEPGSQDAIASVAHLLQELPFRDMVSFGWIDAASSEAAKVDECLDFFAVSSFAQWRGRYQGLFASTAYHKSAAYESCQIATTAWLRQGEIETAGDVTADWSAERLSEQIPNLRRLTWFKSPALFIPKIKTALNSCGVRFAIVRAPKGCRASGAVRLLDDGAPIIQLSFRYLSDDQFWFSLFHEIGHLLLHYDRMPFIEESDMVEDTFEKEANEFSSDVIVPLSFKEELFSLGTSRFPIIAFAKKIGVAPGLIVGQLQHNGLLKYSQMQHLKRRYRWL
jgi:plasmid maintenance system antidote protein VapI